MYGLPYMLFNVKCLMFPLCCMCYRCLLPVARLFWLLPVICRPAFGCNANTQMLLKRAREDALAKNATNSSGNSSSCKRPNNIGSACPSPPRSGLARSSSATTIKAASKIVVNTFHGSSMLNGQQHDEKSKILTQNGLTKSAASALETSLYASLYAQPSQLPFQCINSRIASGEHSSNYMGVSLNKCVSINHEGRQNDDDPCAGNFYFHLYKTIFMCRLTD